MIKNYLIGATIIAILFAQVAAQPANDLIGDAFPISGTGMFSFDNVGATGHFCTNDVFFRWNATCTGIAKATGCGSETIVKLLPSGSSSFGETISCIQSTSSCLTNATVTTSTPISVLAVTMNQEYYISVGSSVQTAGGNFSLECEPRVFSAPNDECESPSAITEGTTYFNASTASNSRNSSPVRDTWYEYTATCDGTMQLTLSSTLNSRVQLFSSCGGGTLTTINSGGATTRSVQVGTKYLIRAGVSDGRAADMPGERNFTIICYPTPANDKMDGDLPVLTTGEEYTVDTTGATQQTCNNDLFFRWNATCDGEARVNGCGFPSSSITQYYTILDSQGLFPSACFGPDASCVGNESLSSYRFGYYHVTNGKEYFISVGTSAYATVTFKVDCVPIVYDAPNDECDDAILINEGIHYYNNTHARGDALRPTTAPFKDVYFKYTAPLNGSVYINFPSHITEYPGNYLRYPAIAVYSQCGETSSIVSRNGVGSLNFAGRENQTYFLRVGSQYGYLDSDNYIFFLQFTPAPLNDERTGAINITGQEIFTFDTSGATTSVCTNDVWYKWSSPCDGIATANACPLGSTIVYRLESEAGLSESGGCIFGSTNCVTNASLPNSFTSSMLVKTGQTVYLSIGSSSSAIGAHNATIACIPQERPYPTNDECTTATSIQPGDHYFSNEDASHYLDEGFTTPYRDLWYSYTTTCTGIMNVALKSFTNTVHLKLVTNCSQQYVSVGSTTSASPISRTVAPGQTYYIRVGSYYASQVVNGTFSVSCLAPSNNDKPGDAIPLTGDGPWNYTVVGASWDRCGYEVFYTWTAPCTGLAKLSSCGLTATTTTYLHIGTTDGYYETCKSASVATINSCSIDDPAAASSLQVQSGSTYLIGAGLASSNGQGAFAIKCIPQTYNAGNDDCSKAMNVTNGVTFYDTTAATNPQTSSTSSPYRDLWYAYTATCKGQVTVDFPSSTSAYAGAKAHPSCTSTTSLLYATKGAPRSTPVDVGDILYIRAGTTDPQYEVSDGAFEIKCTTGPENDEIENATRISGTGVFNYSTDGAISDRCGNADVFFIWSATCTGVARLTGCTLYSSSDTIRQSLMLITADGYSDTSCFMPSTSCPLNDTLGNSRISFLNVQAGVDYYIAAGTNNPGLSSFHLSCEPMAFDLPNDNCENAITITDGTVHYNNTKATNPTSGSLYLYRELWYSYTATCGGVIEITMEPGSLLYPSVELRSSCSTRRTSTSYPNTLSATVSSGVTYLIAAGSNSPSYTGTASFTVTCLAPPPNDQRSNATRIVGTGNFTYDNKGASSNTCNNDVFFLWKATCTGLATVSACGLIPSGYSYVAIMNLGGYMENSCVYTPSSCSPGLPITSGYHGVMQVTQDTDYYIIAGINPTGQAGFALDCIPTSVPPPANDLCENAQAMGDETVSYNTTGATHVLDGYTNSIYHDVFFAYTATCTGIISVRIDGDGYQRGRVLRSCSSSDTLISTITSSGSASVSQGQTYYIRVGASNAVRESAGVLTVSCTPPAVNDERDGAIRITGPTDVLLLNNTASTTSTCTNDVWFIWEATCTGIAMVSGCGFSSASQSPSFIIMDVSGYADISSCSTTSTSCTASDISSTSVASIQVTQGRDYYIGGGFSGAWRAANFSIVCHPQVFDLPNDDCTGAIPVQAGQTYSVDISKASNPTNSTSFSSPYRDAWFSYIAPCTGNVLIEITGLNSFSNAHTRVLSGGCTDTTRCDPSEQISIRDQSGNGIVSAAVTNGREYFIRIGTTNARRLGQVEFNVTCSSPPSNDELKNPIRIHGVGTFPYSTIGASGDTCSNDLYFIWSANCTGIAKLSACNIDDLDATPYMHIQTVDDAFSFTYCSYSYYGCNHDALDDGYTSYLPVFAGQDYIIVAGASSSVENMKFQLTCEPKDLLATTAPNNDCPNAKALNGGVPVTAPLSTSSAAVTDQAIYRELWYTYTSSCSGTLAVAIDRTNSQNPYGAVRVHSQCPTSDNSYLVLSQEGLVSTTIGTQYYISVGTNNYLDDRNVTFSVNCIAPPSNDKYAGAIQLTGNGPYSYSTVNSITDTCTNDVFFSWVATCTGTARLSACGVTQAGTPSQSLRFMTSSTRSSETSCVSVSSSCSIDSPLPNSYVSHIQAIQGQTYLIAAGGSRNADLQFQIQCDPIVFDLPNDDCTQPTTITDGIINFDNSRASHVQDVNPPFYRDLFYSYTSTCDGTIAVKVLPGAFSGVRVAFERVSDTATSCNVYSSAFITSNFATLSTQLGTRYQVRVGSSGYATGNASFSITCAPAPPNDNLSNAIRITGNGPFNYDTTGSTASYCSNDVVFRWQATCTGIATVSACGLYTDSSLPAPILRIQSLAGYGESGCLASTTSCSHTDALSTNRISYLQVYAGTDYYISAATSAAWGNASFQIACTPQPIGGASNDECTGAILVRDGTHLVDNTKGTGRQEVGATSPYRDLWYAYRTNCPGTVSISVDPLCGTGNRLALFAERDTSADCNSYTSANYVYSSSGVYQIPVVPEKTYVIRVGPTTAYQASVSSLRISTECEPGFIDGAGSLTIGFTLIFMLVAFLLI